MQKQPSKPIEIKISTVVAVSAILHVADMATLDRAMKEMTGGMPDFFDDEFAVIDVAPLDGAAVDWPALVALLKNYRLNAVAVRNAPESMKAGILAQGLSIDAGVTRPRETDAAQAEPAAAPAPQPAVEIAAEPAAPSAPAASHTMIVDTPVRAGQRIYARGADLIITAVVNNGAEVIADGSIHVYAPLHGRALAGASATPRRASSRCRWSRNWCRSPACTAPSTTAFRPSWHSQPAQIRLVGDRLDISSLGSGAHDASHLLRYCKGHFSWQELSL
jgi:septum site-determining protein MinC